MLLMIGNYVTMQITLSIGLILCTNVCNVFKDVNNSTFAECLIANLSIII